LTAEILSAVQGLVARIAKIPPPDADGDMYSAGLKSVDALELLLEVEDAFGVAIPDDRFVAVRSCRELTALIGELATGKVS
jgi:acyl carrier protein